MRSKFLLMIFVSTPASLICQTLDHQAVQQNIPVPEGWVPAPKLVLDNTRNLPVVFVEQGHLTTITFPKEMEWCSQKNTLFSHRIKGRQGAADGDSSGGTPFTEIDVFTKPEGIAQVSQELSLYGRDIYSAEPGNMNCRFTSGEIAIIMLKIAPRPYMSVEFVLPGARRDYSAFAGSGSSIPAGIKTAPYDPKFPASPSLPRAEAPAIANDTKRDWSVFRSASGEQK